MIKKIEVKNFKNISEEVVELHPYINSFVGENGSGKSSIIFKAPRLVLQNENWPISKIKSGETSSSITVHSSKNTITRERTKTSTKVIINGVEYDGKKNVQGDIESLGFYNTTKLGKNVELHFLKSNDILDFMPKSPESFYLKLSTIFGFNRIIDLKKEYSTLLKGLTKDIESIKKQEQDCCNNLEKIDAEVLMLRNQLFVIEQIEDLKRQLLILRKTTEISKELNNVTKSNLKLKTTNFYSDILKTVEEMKCLNSSLCKRVEKTRLLNLLTGLSKPLVYLRSISSKNTQLIQYDNNRLALVKEYDLLPRCPQCKKVL